jgi:tRNA(Arg) A34 adenosine deaminase TadA
MFRMFFDSCFVSSFISSFALFRGFLKNNNAHSITPTTMTTSSHPPYIETALSYSSSLVINLPPWATEYYNSLSDKEFKTDEEMMKVAIDMAALNVSHDTGGPFGCAIFERDIETKTSKVISLGCNRVVTLNNSTCHAEMVAIQFAQQKLKQFSLKDNGTVFTDADVAAGSTKQGVRSGGGGELKQQKRKEYVLHTSCEPCAMCLGGTFWSGVSELVCSATKDDAEAIGFDEGPVFPESYQHLERAGMVVKKCILRAEGAKVLNEYGATGVIYNG